MTTTTIISSQSFGTSTNVGNGMFSPSATTMQTTSTAFVVNVKYVGGSGQAQSQTQRLRVWYTCCFATITAALAPEQLGQTAHYVDVVLDRNTAFCDSQLEPVTGTKFYCWVDAPNQSVAGAVTVTLIELP